MKSSRLPTQYVLCPILIGFGAFCTGCEPSEDDVAPTDASIPRPAVEAGTHLSLDTVGFDSSVGVPQSPADASISPPTVCDAAVSPEIPTFKCDAVDMVWRNESGGELRRDVNCASGKSSSSGFCYDFAADACDGYRCLLGNDISPACYSQAQCSVACSGTCVLISSQRGRCAQVDGGEPELPAIRCDAVDMVWRSESGGEQRRDVNCASGKSSGGFCYDFAADACDGYRCLVGNDIGPACYSQAQCPAACSGTCVLIPSQRARCAQVDGGVPDLPAIKCDAVDMVWWSESGGELRRDFNCASGKSSSSGFCYDFAADACDGYRCLVGNDISPSCYSQVQCPAACSGTCVLIPSQRGLCARVDGGPSLDSH